ncbi:hypothetical protein TNCV_1228401 [Trichonephila clavipes]|nr:hypothetical protein TNCV_1228401 [Trichonephila clavipes]
MVDQATLSEWTKTAPLKKSRRPNQFAQEGRAGQILEGLTAQKRSSSFAKKELENTSRKKDGLKNVY